MFLLRPLRSSNIVEIGSMHLSFLGSRRRLVIVNLLNISILDSRVFMKRKYFVAVLRRVLEGLIFYPIFVGRLIASLEVFLCFAL